MTGLVLLLSCVLGASVLLWMTVSRHGLGKYVLARKLEADGRYREACYCFALSILSGVKTADCRTRIKALWQRFGPFDFSGEEYQAKAGGDYGSGTAGHALTMRIIEEIVKRRP